jgi:subtilisin family serine protease
MSVANRSGLRLPAAAALAMAIAEPLAAQLGGLGGVLPGAQDGVGEIVGPVGGRIGESIDSTRGAAEGLIESVENVEATVESLVDEIDRIAAAATEVFAGDEDAAGQSIERDIWIVLVPAEFSDRIPGWGFTIRERNELDDLDLVFLRIEAPDDRSMTETEQELTEDAPGTVVDFNHVYGPGQEDAPPTLAGRSASAPAPPIVAMPTDALTLGLIDSAIATAHEAFGGVSIMQRDFVPYQGERPRLHGTAVASIAIEALRSTSGEASLGLFAASVFFTDDDGEQSATTGGLVAALEWLGSQSVQVINMSLTGPPNRVLEAALNAAARRGTIIVAAVGNDGPSGEPLYPAAYESVLGITAVDAEQHVYRRANRGPQVDFAARGVRVRVANVEGGYGRETGTSMAAPVAAAVIASALASTGEPAGEVLQELEVAAVDLGAAGFDEVYGHGLLATGE